MAKQKKIEEEKAGRDNRANQLNPNHKEYKTPVLYLRKSKAGDHLYAFNVQKRDSQGNGGEGKLLGDSIGSLIANVSDVQAVISGKMEWAKMSVLPAEDRE
jgi:hypothetical protein